MAYYTVWFSKTSDNTDIAVRDVHYIIHGVANRTKPNQKPIEPNRTQSFDWSSIGSAIEHNRTGTFL